MLGHQSGVEQGLERVLRQTPTKPNSVNYTEA